VPVDASGDVGVKLPVKKYRNATGQLHNFDAAPDIPTGLFDRLSVLASY
jgi:hypothetical protein